MRDKIRRNLHLLHEPLFSNRLKIAFAAFACVEILHPRSFIHRRLDALPEKAQGEDQHVAGRVAYCSPEDSPGNVWALPDVITMTKLKRFEYQDEYRLAYTNTDAFAFENCTNQLVDRPARPAPRPEEHFHETLTPGSLRRICRLHRF